MAAAKGKSRAPKRNARNRALRPEAADKIRDQIQTLHIAKQLQKHVDGELEMASTQVTAALGLLRKTLPDLAATEHSGDLSQTVIHRKAYDIPAQQPKPNGHDTTEDYSDPQ